MTMRRLLRDHYASKSLRPDVRARMSALVEDGAKRGTSKVRRLVWAAVAATIALAVFWAWPAGDPTERFGVEIARNHRRALGPEFRAASYGELAQRMDRLDFELRPSRRLVERGCRLVGGRYCSLGGRIAAQLRLIDQRGRKLTLYVVRSASSMKEGRRPYEGVPVELWNEGELIYGLAGGDS